MEGNRFAPKNNATRAQVAMILRNFLQNGTPAPEQTPDASGKVLVAYFSVTGNTENIAQHLETVLDADLYKIVPRQPYTSADLNYGSASLSSVESWLGGLDIPASQADASAAKITLTFQDYAGSEKISYLSRNLSADGAPGTYDPDAGDLILYAPWGNLAIFYRDAGRSSGPVPMGHVESGFEQLAAMNGNFEVTITRIG